MTCVCGDDDDRKEVEVDDDGFPTFSDDEDDGYILTADEAKWSIHNEHGQCKCDFCEGYLYNLTK
jgi:hypothetical protein